MRGLTIVTNPILGWFWLCLWHRKQIGMSVNQFTTTTLKNIDQFHFQWPPCHVSRSPKEVWHKSWCIFTRNRMPRRVYRQHGTDQIVTFDRVTSPSVCLAKLWRPCKETDSEWRVYYGVLCTLPIANEFLASDLGDLSSQPLIMCSIDSYKT